MKRMRTFLLYALGIIGFIILSLILEDGLLRGMYKPLNNNSDKYISSSSGIDIQIEEASSSKTNGSIIYKITNNSNEKITDKYVKLDLYNEQGLLAATEYIKIDELEPGESKNYNVKFKGSDITDYKIATLSESEIPDKSNLISILGFEFDLSNVFGINLENTKLFGKRVKDIFDVNKLDGVKGKAKNAWGWAVNFAKAVPWWGYVIGGGIILWYMPSGYLFGIFP